MTAQIISARALKLLFALTLFSESIIAQQFNAAVYHSANQHKPLATQSNNNTYIAFMPSQDPHLGPVNILMLDDKGIELKRDHVNIFKAGTAWFSSHSDLLALSDGSIILCGTYRNACDVIIRKGFFLWKFDSQLNLTDSISFWDTWAFDGLGRLTEIDNQRILLTASQRLVLFDENLHILDSMIVQVPGTKSGEYLSNGTKLHMKFNGNTSLGWVDSAVVVDLNNRYVSNRSLQPDGQWYDLNDSSYISLDSNQLFLLKVDSLQPTDTFDLSVVNISNLDLVETRREVILLSGSGMYCVLSAKDLSILDTGSIRSRPLSSSVSASMSYQDSVLGMASVVESGVINYESKKLADSWAPRADDPHIECRFGAYQVNRIDTLTGPIYDVSMTADLEFRILNQGTDTIHRVAISYWFFKGVGVVCGGLKQLLEADSLNLLPGDSVILTKSNQGFSKSITGSDLSFNIYSRTMMVNHNIIRQPKTNIDTLVVNDLSGLNEHSYSLLSVYPNPISDLIEIESKVKLNGLLSLMNTNGELVFTRRISLEPNQELRLETDAIPKGVYILMLKEEDQISSYKLIKR